MAPGDETPGDEDEDDKGEVDELDDDDRRAKAGGGGDEMDAKAELGWKETGDDADEVEERGWVGGSGDCLLPIFTDAAEARAEEPAEVAAGAGLVAVRPGLAGLTGWKAGSAWSRSRSRSGTRSSSDWNSKPMKGLAGTGAANPRDLNCTRLDEVPTEGWSMDAENAEDVGSAVDGRDEEKGSRCEDDRLRESDDDSAETEEGGGG